MEYKKEERSIIPLILLLFYGLVVGILLYIAFVVIPNKIYSDYKSKPDPSSDPDDGSLPIGMVGDFYDYGYLIRTNYQDNCCAEVVKFQKHDTSVGHVYRLADPNSPLKPAFGNKEYKTGDTVMAIGSPAGPFLSIPYTVSVGSNYPQCNSC